MNARVSHAAAPGAGSDGPSFQAMLVPLLTVELLLLAFFILLNAVSNIEDRRTQSVLESVRAAFGAAETEDAEADLDTPDVSLAELERQIAMLAHALGAVEGQAPAQENALWIDLPVQALFRPGEDRLSAAQARFIDRLAALLAQTPAGHGYEVAVLRGSADAADADTDLRLRQAAAMAAALRAKVEPRGTIAAGLVPDPAIGMRLAVSWRPTEPARAR